MFLDASTLTALAIVGAVGAFAGFVGGFIAGADSLFGALLMGIVGGIALSAIMRGAGAPPVYAVGAQEFSVVWSAVGGIFLGYIVGRSNL